MHLTASLAAADPGGRACREMAVIAEHGGFDALWLGHRQDGFFLDPLPLVGALVGVTTRIGLGAWWPVDHAEPFHVARVLATLDHLSGGRIAWLAAADGPVSDEALFAHAPGATGAAWQARAAEFTDIVEKLWDSWEDEAWLLDVPSGRFADPARVHPLHHRGAHFAVRGPLNVPRPVQGRPVVARCGLDPAAEVVLVATPPPEPVAARVLLSLTPGEATLEAMATHLRDGYCDGFDLTPAGPEDLRRFVEEIVPKLRAEGLRPPGYGGTTLRDHLGLARPRSQFAA